MHWFLIVACYWWVLHAFFGGDLGGMTIAGPVLALAFSLVGSAATISGCRVAELKSPHGLVLTLVLVVEKGRPSRPR